MYTNDKHFNYKIEIYTWLCNQPSVKPKTNYVCRSYMDQIYRFVL